MGFCVTEGGTKVLFQLRNQNGDRRIKEVLTIASFKPKSHVGGEVELLGRLDGFCAGAGHVEWLI